MTKWVWAAVGVLWVVKFAVELSLGHPEYLDLLIAGLSVQLGLENWDKETLKRQNEALSQHQGRWVA